MTRRKDDTEKMLRRPSEPPRSGRPSEPPRSARPSEPPRASRPSEAPDAPAGKGAAAEAERLLAADDARGIAEHVEHLFSDARTTATHAARVVAELALRKPEKLASHADRFVQGLASETPRVAQASAEALPRIAAVAPARVAKHLERLKTSFQSLPEVGKDGVVRTFAALCAASVAYQKRLEPVLAAALSGADDRTLVAWTLVVLPSLKGEPHANARAVVEKRLPELGRAEAQAIADFLGIKLRPRPR